MRNFFILILILLFSNLVSQNLLKDLQSKTWFWTGKLYNQKSIIIFTVEKKDYDQQTKFLISGKLFSKGISKETAFDQDGNEIPPGKHFQDSTYTYVLKNDILKVDYSFTEKERFIQRISYYNLKKLANNKGYELIPAKADF